MRNQTILTESSLRQLREELEYLKTSKRRELAEALRTARAYGDLSENFEYHAARRDQAIVNGRIAQIEAMIEHATIVSDEPAGDPDAIGLGSRVRVRIIDDDEEWEFTLVDPVQADPIMDLISIQSPMASALLDKTVGDVVDVAAPGGVIRYEILGIQR